MDNRLKKSIEEKRAKLAELRRANQAWRQRTDERGSGADTPSSQPSVGKTNKADLDLIVSDLLTPSASGPPSSHGPSSSGVASPGAVPKPGDRAGKAGAGQRVASGETSASSREVEAVPPAVDREAAAFGSPLAALPTFTDSSQPLFELRPKPRLTYPRAVQTDSTQYDSTQNGDAGHVNVGSSTLIPSQDEEAMRAKLWKEYEADRMKKEKELEDELRAMERALEESRLKGPEPAELNTIFSGPDFGHFLEESSKIVQRALSDGYDYLRDYTISGATGADDSEGKLVKASCTFWDDKWTKNRSVTDLDWSHKFPELSVASFNKNPGAFNEPDGVVCVWNLHLVDRPEFVFHSQSDVLSVSFSPFHPNLVVGGTYSGQILLFDTRSRHHPVLKTPLSAAGHTHPIYSLSLVGTQNAHNLVSASSDGTVCTWVLDMLSRPQETLELLHPGQHKTDEVSVTCLAFPEGEPAAFWVGTEEGNVYTCNRHDRAGVKAGLVQNEVYRGHSGPVTGINFHPMAGPVDFSDLFLTCGVDWTVRLWRTKGSGSSKSDVRASTPALPTPLSSRASGPPGSTSSAAASSTVSPLYSFEEADDYIFDARWHPFHPATFGTVDGAGRFGLWNLNVDTEVPVESTTLGRAGPGGKGVGLNKLAWDRRGGRKAAIGGSDGRVYIYDIGELAVPRENEWENLRKAFAGMVGSSSGPAR